MEDGFALSAELLCLSKAVRALLANTSSETGSYNLPPPHLETLCALLGMERWGIRQLVWGTLGCKTRLAVSYTMLVQLLYC